MKPILKSGCLAYFDTVSYGLVKCKVMEISDGVAIIKITASKGACLRGETTFSSVNFVYPRDAVKVRKCGTTVSAYKIKAG